MKISWSEKYRNKATLGTEELHSGHLPWGQITRQTIWVDRSRWCLEPATLQYQHSNLFQTSVDGSICQPPFLQTHQWTSDTSLFWLRLERCSIHGPASNCRWAATATVYSAHLTCRLWRGRTFSGTSEITIQIVTKQWGDNTAKQCTVASELTIQEYSVL